METVISTTNIKHNYLEIAHFVGKDVRCCAVVKGNAYGIGLRNVAAALLPECKDFLVADISEALEVFNVASEANLSDNVNIYVLHGPDSVDNALLGIKRRFIFVINAEAQFLLLVAALKAASDKIPTPRMILYVEVGMVRTGFSAVELSSFTAKYSNQNHDLNLLPLILGIECIGLMGHMSVSEVHSHPLNEVQLERFKSAVSLVQNVWNSVVMQHTFANSFGVLLGTEYHFSMVRVGVLLYSDIASHPSLNLSESVIKISANILQKVILDEDAVVGYGGNLILKRGSKIITAECGYWYGWYEKERRGFCMCMGHKIHMISNAMQLAIFDASSMSDADFLSAQSVNLIDDVMKISNLHERLAHEMLCKIGRLESKKIYI
ncbi:Alanine racemase, biosynthetic [Candidatus Fokinia solitaria]|uniref:alanine racemase n=1 Tax=Candidatus Fokinia solitaria TaxID=1802984 RepID=A0A2U8BSX7_9RICK|nr:alanine racemase [Candidatus Fokinia solitaria]AWD33451.1 Alanine racemase, biosynthetic [Candidatus Fokinia solitaria]